MRYRVYMVGAPGYSLAVTSIVMPRSSLISLLGGRNTHLGYGAANKVVTAVGEREAAKIVNRIDGRLKLFLVLYDNTYAGNNRGKKTDGNCGDNQGINIFHKASLHKCDKPTKTEDGRGGGKEYTESEKKQLWYGYG